MKGLKSWTENITRKDKLMKKMATLGLALALFALALPAYPAPPPYCWDLEHYSCSFLNSTRTCTDGTWSDYVCTCREFTPSFPQPPYPVLRWECPELR
jgi:hypothetical protein